MAYLYLQNIQDQKYHQAHRINVNAFVQESKDNVINAAEVIQELEEKIENILTVLKNPFAVRINILKGTIRKPDDLVFFYDDFGPVADLRKRIAYLEAQLKRGE